MGVGAGAGSLLCGLAVLAAAVILAHETADPGSGRVFVGREGFDPGG